MSRRLLPELRAERHAAVKSAELDEVILARWNADLRPAAATSEEASISILEPIGQDYWSGEGVTLKRIAAALRSIGERDVVVNINSPGGDMFEGIAIYNALRQHKGAVTVRVLGLAASAASIIAMAGDRIEIGKPAFLMIHNCWVLAIGNRHDLIDAAKSMESFDAAMAGIYVDRAGVDLAQAAAWMDAETWFNGAEAVEAGLADEFLAADLVREVEGDEPGPEAARATAAVRRIDAALARTGMPRSERRALVAEIKKGGMPGAAPTVTPDADLTAALARLEATMRS